MPDESSDALSGALAPLLARSDLDLVDVEVGPGTLRVTVDRDGGVDLDALAEANRTVSAALDELDPLPGRYTLEVSSPGLERRLRTPAHFARALGETVSVRTLPGTAAGRRLRGRLAASDDAGFVLEGPDLPGGSVRLAHDEVERARTVFEWGATPKGAARAATPKGAARAAAPKGAAEPAGERRPAPRSSRGSRRAGPKTTTERVPTR